MKSYLVAYTINDVDHYVIFCDGNNKKKAKKFYKKLLKREDLYCANICKIKKTTEHYE